MPDAGVMELEHLLEKHLNTRVKVDLSGPRGRVIVEFADLDDLERIYRAVTGAPLELTTPGLRPGSAGRESVFPSLWLRLWVVTFGDPRSSPTSPSDAVPRPAARIPVRRRRRATRSRGPVPLNRSPVEPRPSVRGTEVAGATVRAPARGPGNRW